MNRTFRTLTCIYTKMCCWIRILSTSARGKTSFLWQFSKQSFRTNSNTFSCDRICIQFSKTSSLAFFSNIIRKQVFALRTNFNTYFFCIIPIHSLCALTDTFSAFQMCIHGPWTFCNTSTIVLIPKCIVIDPTDRNTRFCFWLGESSYGAGWGTCSLRCGKMRRKRTFGLTLFG